MPEREHTVLIIDDDDSIRELYRDAFTAADIKVFEANNGEEGARTALKEHPDVILMDIMMPNMDGHEAVKMIRRDDWGKNARVIYLTNLSDPENVVSGIKQNPDAYIVKANTDVHEVVNKVRLAIHKDA